jgi:hypothetical protein
MMLQLSRIVKQTTVLKRDAAKSYGHVPLSAALSPATPPLYTTTEHHRPALGRPTMEITELENKITFAIQLTKEVLSRCSNDLKTDKNTKDDINRLQRQLATLKNILKDANNLLQDPVANKLKAFPGLESEIAHCSWYLRILASRLRKSCGTIKYYKITSMMGVRRLKWPFQSKEDTEFIRSLQEILVRLSTALNLDPAYVADFISHQLTANGPTEHSSSTI